MYFVAVKIKANADREVEDRQKEEALKKLHMHSPPQHNFTYQYASVIK